MLRLRTVICKVHEIRAHLDAGDEVKAQRAIDSWLATLGRAEESERRRQTHVPAAGVRADPGGEDAVGAPTGPGGPGG